MISIDNVVITKDISNEVFFNRQLMIAEGNYKEIKIRKKGESGFDWLNRIDDFETNPKYGRDLIFKLRNNFIDTQEKCIKRILDFNKFYKKVYLINDQEILDSMKKESGETLKQWSEKVIKIIKKYENYIYCLRDFTGYDETPQEFQTRLVKVSKILSDIEAKSKMDLELISLKKQVEEKFQENLKQYKKEINDRSKEKIEEYKNSEKNKAKLRRQGEREDENEELKLKLEIEEKKIEEKKIEKYDNTIFKGFMVFIYSFSLCLFLSLYFIAHVLGYLSLIICGGFIFYLYISEDLRRQINENKVYRFVMEIIFKFSNVTSSVLKESGHATIRKELDK